MAWADDWLRDSLEAKEKELRARAAFVRKSYKGGAMAKTTARLADVYDRAADVFKHELETLRALDDMEEGNPIW